MPDPEAKRLPKWPLLLALSLVVLLEVLFVVRLSAEGGADKIPMIANSVGILVFCVLTWRGFLWSRWLLIALLVCRIAHIGIEAVLNFGPGDHRIPGTLVLVTLYVVAGLVAASPLGRLRTRAAT